MLTLYTYKGCGSCQKAIKFLSAHNIEFEQIAIRETAPKKSELQLMLDRYNGEIKKLFNISGLDYRQENLKDKLPQLSVDEALSLLENNGNLVKRPFVLSENFKCVGFKESDWIDALNL